MLINGSIPSLINGVSQQPHAIRLPTQAEEQENAYSSLVEGMGKRPPTEHVAQLVDPGGGPMSARFINRDQNEKYILMLGSSGTVRAYTTDGEAVPVIPTPDATSYLSAHSPNPDTDFRTITIADATFILNRKRKVAMRNTLVGSRPYEVIFWVKAGNYGTKYQIKVASVTIEYTTSEDDVSDIQTMKIAEALHYALDAALPSQNWSVGLNGNYIYVVHSTGQYFEASCTDSNGGRNLTMTARDVQSFADLPNYAVEGFTVRVVGNKEQSEDDYYVRFHKTNPSQPFTLGPGTWVETAKPGVLSTIDERTMPFALNRYQDTDGSVTGTVGKIYFRLEAVNWAERECGDDTSNPIPSFVGRSLSDIFLHRNRLGFLSDTNVILSQSGDYVNFWRSTTQTVLDSDPIDVSVSHPRIAILRHAVQFGEDLVLFSDQVQFILRGGDLLTPKTVNITPETEYECDPVCKPVGAGNLIYFPYPNGGFAGMREYFTEVNTGRMDANPVTAHVPKYIKGAISHITVSTTEDMMVCMSQTSRQQLYVYKWFWAGQDKIQSSWSKWTFGTGTAVYSAFFDGSTLWLVLFRDGKVWLEKMQVDPGRTDPYLNYVTSLDRRVLVPRGTVTFDGTYSYFTAPYIPLVSETPAAFTTMDEDGGIAGREIQIENINSSGQVKLLGDYRDQPFYFGIRYTMKYRFSNLMLREQTQTGGVEAITAGRLQIRSMSLTYARTGYLRAVVTPAFRTPSSYVLNRTLGSSENVIGQAPIGEGVFRFTVASKNDQVTIDIINDSALPCWILSANWEGFYNTRARRV